MNNIAIIEQGPYVVCTNKECGTSFRYGHNPPIFCSKCQELTLAGCLYCRNLFYFSPDPFCAYCGNKVNDELQNMLYVILIPKINFAYKAKTFVEFPDKHRKMLLEQAGNYIPFLNLYKGIKPDKLSGILEMHTSRLYIDKILNLYPSYQGVTDDWAKKLVRQ